MGSDQAYQEIISQVCAMARDSLADSLLHFDGELPLDFSSEYLADCSTERMQHLLAAALWRCFVKQLSTGLASHVCA